MSKDNIKFLLFILNRYGGDEMNGKFKSFVYGIMGVFLGFIIVGIIRDGNINWGTTSSLFILLFFIFLFKLGLSLYKEKD